MLLKPNVHYHGFDCYVIEGSRSIPEVDDKAIELMEQYNHMYYLIHTGEDNSRPCAVQRFALVNRWGYLFTRAPFPGSCDVNFNMSLAPEDQERFIKAAQGVVF